MRIGQALTSWEIVAIRGLFQEYAVFLGIDLRFQGFAQELQTLPGEYAPPRGRLLLATASNKPVGCVALRPLGLERCEMKRLFVIPRFQAQGLGRELAERVIAEARQIGYSTMVLDTLPFLRKAIGLYESLGFARCPAYYATPLPDTVFLELRL